MSLLEEPLAESGINVHDPNFELKFLNLEEVRDLDCIDLTTVSLLISGDTFPQSLTL